MRLAPGKTVLIVEPDSDARSQLHSVFDAAGYTVVETASGDDALSVVDNPEIMLVVTEMYLDNSKSRCLLNAICAPAPGRHAKVLAYTSHGGAKDRAWAIAAGADGYVLKKNGEARLLEVAGRLSRRARRARRASNRGTRS
jgi:two-component system chemotaxis sensor kinase CheA